MTGAPQAVRARRAGLRDPRLAAGIGLVALAVVLGAWVLGDRGRTVPVLVVRHDLHAGASINRADVRLARVRLDPTIAGRYAAHLAAGRSLSRDVLAGELLPASSLEPAETTARVEVPLSVAVDDLPATVGAGSVVDVWVVPAAAQTRADTSTAARLVLSNVTVEHLGGASSGLAPEDTRQVIVTVPDSHHKQLGRAIGQVASGRVVITRRP